MALGLSWRGARFLRLFVLHKMMCDAAVPILVGKDRTIPASVGICLSIVILAINCLPKHILHL